MPQLCRVLDTTITKKPVLVPALTVMAEGRPVATHPNIVTGGKTLIGSATVYCEGRPVLYTGAPTTKGPMALGALTVSVGALAGGV